MFPQFWDTFTIQFHVCTFSSTKSGIKLLIFTLEQKLKMHWNGVQKTYLLSYCTSKSEQAENSLVLPTLYEKFCDK